MNLAEYQDIIVRYGYLAIIVGSMLEGEMVLVLGGFLAHQGYLSLPGVVGSAFLGTLSADQFFFFLGRTRGRPYLRSRPGLMARVVKADRLVSRHRLPVVLGFRFLYGMRTIIPFALGLSSLRAGFFVPLNVIGALIWASVVGVAGYLFGRVLTGLLEKAARHEDAVFLGLAAAAVLVWGVLLARARRKPPPI